MDIRQLVVVITLCMESTIGLEKVVLPVTLEKGARVSCKGGPPRNPKWRKINTENPHKTDVIGGPCEFVRNSNRCWADEADGRALVIRNAKFEDMGIYECVVKSKVKVQVRVQEVVTGCSPCFMNATTKSMRVTMRDTIACNVSLPQEDSSLHWYRLSTSTSSWERILPCKFDFDTNHVCERSRSRSYNVLVINKSRFSDSGTYKCSVESPKQELYVGKYVNLQVENPALSLHDSKAITLFSKQDLQEYFIDYRFVCIGCGMLLTSPLPGVKINLNWFEKNRSTTVTESLTLVKNATEPTQRFKLVRRTNEVRRELCVPEAYFPLGKSKPKEFACKGEFIGDEDMGKSVTILREIRLVT